MHSYQKVEIWLFIATVLHDKFSTSQWPLIKARNLSIYSVALYPSSRNVGDLGSVPGLGRSPGEGKGYPFRYSGLENSMDYGRSVQFSCSVMSGSLRPHEPQHARPPCLSPTPRIHPNPVHWVGDAIQPSHPLLSPSPPALNLSQHQGLFKWVSSSHQGAKVLEF